jgi:hypothetical protein
MGGYNERASRQVGETTTENFIKGIGIRTKELIAVHTATCENPLTFADVEQI